MQALHLGLQLHQRGRLEQAEPHYRAVLAAEPNHFDALHLLGLLRFQQGRHSEAIDHISAALRVEPKAAPALSNLGLALAAAGRLEEALASFDKALAVEPRNAEALNNRGNVLLHLARFDAALASLDRALAVNPASFEALNNRGKALLGLNKPAAALATFDKALALRRDHPEALCNRGNALLSLNRPPEALASFNKALALRPDSADALNGRGKSLLSLKHPEKALASFDKALAITADFADALNGRGNTLLSLKQPAEALASFDKALAIKPDFAEALNNRGNALLDIERPKEALASFDKALAIKPDYAEALGNRGTALAALRRSEEALLSLDKALALKPRQAEFLYNRGNRLMDLISPEQALASFDRALAIKPDFVQALKRRGDALMELKRPEDALASYEKALAIQPDHAECLNGKLSAAQRTCRWMRAKEIADRFVSEKAWRRSPDVALPFLMLAYCDDPSVHLDCARHAVEALTKGRGSSPAPRWTALPQTGSKLRIAYISADFRVHPVAALTCQMFELHDRARFEVFGISTGADDRSEMRSRIAKAFDRFLDVRRQSDEEIAGLLNDLQVDIAVDLTGHTRDGRPVLLASRPVPIQVSYLGYAGTTGADFIDYVIADPIILPFDQQPYYTERIVHLPDCFLVNDSKRPLPSATPTRKECGLPEDGLVFCCFNNDYKITQEIFEVWMRILAANPGSVLWLRRESADSERNLRRAASARGIDATRLVFAQRLQHYEDHLARHRQADLFLDTLPYNAHTTASDALWAGLPVLTCMGRSFASRVAASLLHAVGLPELVTHSLADYESLALRLAADPARLKEYKQRLDENRRTCALFDTARFTRHIEAAYMKMWEIHRRGEGPQSFSVSA